MDASAVFVVASVDPNNPSGWLVATPTAYSASAQQGTYQWVAKASRSNVLAAGGSEQYDADAGVFTLVPNLATASAASRCMIQVWAGSCSAAGPSTESAARKRSSSSTPLH